MPKPPPPPVARFTDVTLACSKQQKCLVTVCCHHFFLFLVNLLGNSLDLQCEKESQQVASACWNLRKHRVVAVTLRKSQSQSMLPSQSTLSRRRNMVHVAWLLLRRRLFSGMLQGVQGLGGVVSIFFKGGQDLQTHNITCCPNTCDVPGCYLK